MNPKDLTLYVITDRTWLDGAPLEDAVRAAIEGGATIVQIREKHVTTEEYIARAKPIQAVCQAYLHAVTRPGGLFVDFELRGEVKV